LSPVPASPQTGLVLQRVGQLALAECLALEQPQQQARIHAA
jgi:hypothetical protein